MGDGGFGEVKHMYNSGRWVTAAILYGFVIYNVYFVASLDLSFIKDPEAAAIALGTTYDQLNKFYFSGILFCDNLRPYLGDKTPGPVRIIGVLELLGLLFFICNLLFCIIQVLVCTGFRKWFAFQNIFWQILPTLSVYSAMRLLYIIVPITLTSRLTEMVAQRKELKDEGKSLAGANASAVAFVFQIIFSFIVGFDTFLMKLRVVSAAASCDVPGGLVGLVVIVLILMSTVQFLIQVMGVVQLGPFVRKRLFKFIFGGEDGILQDEEIVLMETWEALLCKRMYRDLPGQQFYAVMASFSDEDFQSLVLNEDKEAKAELEAAMDAEG